MFELEKCIQECEESVKKNARVRSRTGKMDSNRRRFHQGRRYYRC
ncbi:hypothetical protein HPHPH16_0062 [Helicobacter pylori Hp H-16]|nr:hypothetical protein HPHPH16_0062 [Helicobacter pylori Hp H-16]